MALKQTGLSIFFFQFYLFHALTFLIRLQFPGQNIWWEEIAPLLLLMYMPLGIASAGYTQQLQCSAHDHLSAKHQQAWTYTLQSHQTICSGSEWISYLTKSPLGNCMCIVVLNFNQIMVNNIV